MSKSKKKQKLKIRIFAVVTLLSCLLTGAVLGGSNSVEAAEVLITKLDQEINTNIFDFLDSSVIYQLPDTVKDTDTISLIIQTEQTPLLDAYHETDNGLTFTQYAFTTEADSIRDAIAAEKSCLLEQLDQSGVTYKVGADYSVVFSGFELVITASDFETVCQAFEGRANTYVGEVYAVSETQLVENEVDVYETGIFDSSDFAYDGTGIVVAVLDTGLDYYHSAFSLDNFKADRSQLGLTFEEVSQLIGDTKATQLEPGLTASDVYINEKVPFAFDYADEDSDVYPIREDHGTHVSGIIAGKDDTITGVAPNAQLVEMKIFSDLEDSARTSWILDAVEDCVILGVDVINMSIGTPAGFSRENDEEFVSGVYQAIRDQGISLVVAAANNYNSTYGSEKNGNLGLTSNPDSATVGSPGTYAGALSVASVSGVKTPYLTYNGKIIYFNESTDRVAEEKHFIEELLGENTESAELEYITIPGAGRSADYTGIDVTGKIVLVSRGSTTFEEKANVAQSKGAAGLIVYNNVSGDIKMNVGDTTLPVCSISQDDGEVLAAAGTGKIKVSVSQASGPFMSDFSSWGPAPDLTLKPEITAHGGSILSSVPGQDYDRISGTSMACPNISGVTALLRQYVKENFPEIANDPVKVTALVQQLMMSTADILYGKNGLPYSVRLQGAGLANLANSATTTAYIITYDRNDGSEMSKSKIELGDDPQKTGVYNLVFSIVNFGDADLSYDLSAYVMTEGVSDTKTSHGETTVTQEGYILEGASVEITSIENGSSKDKTVTVAAGQEAKITVTISLSDEDKAYMDSSFENGMYVEGFVTLTAKKGTEVNLSIPYLAFYGDWTKAPILDLDFYATNKDELDDALDMEDKTLPDAYATRPIGGISGDYVSYLGSYYFEQNPAFSPIAADRKYISLSNQETTVNSLRFIWAGLLRNAAKVEIVITEDSTGKVIFERTENDIRKAYGEGAGIYPANVDVEFSAIEHNLNNNSTYTVNMKAYLDYGDGGEESNLCNEFEFPLVADFEAPAITDCEFYTEYDSASEEMRYFAKLAVYDNHYSMGLQVGYVGHDASTNSYMLYGFDQYLTPVYSAFNSTNYVTYELTDHINEIRKNASNRNTITVACYDYALNEATYEIELPDDFLDITFGETEIVLNPYEVVDLIPLVYPEGEWSELLEFYCTSPASGEVARVVNNKLVGVAPGKSVVIARDPETKKQATISVIVRGEDDPEYYVYDKPVLDEFRLTGYYVNKAYYYLSSEEREIGLTGDERKFDSSYYALSMFPSESVYLRYELDAFFPNDTEVVFESSNTDIVTVDDYGNITAQAEGFASVSVRVLMDGKSTYYSQSIDITVKDPYITTGASLTHYFGLGGTVEIPETLSITEIGQYAFANFDYIDKEPHEITDEEPDATKIWYIGDATVNTVIIPEGVTKIGDYAFANLTELTTVILPSTLEHIGQGAFYGCSKLETVEGIENVKFINQGAFYGCRLKDTISLDSAVAIADNAFANNERLKEVILSKDTISVGKYAFYNCSKLEKLTINAEHIKLGQYVFAECSSLTEVSVNSSVIPRGAFENCSDLENVVLGKDVAVIGEYAFGGTSVSSITFDSGNAAFKVSTDGTYVTNSAGNELVLVLPSVKGTFTLNDPLITRIGTGAFSGNRYLKAVELPYITEIGNYAFAGCDRLTSASFGKLVSIGNYAFSEAGLKEVPDLSGVAVLGDYAFAQSKLESITIPDNMTVGTGAFSNCSSLESVIIGDGVILGERAFWNDTNENWTSYYETVNNTRYYYCVYVSPILNITIGDHVQIGDYAFYGAAEVEKISLGSGVSIGDYAFYNASKLKEIDLSKVTSIGDYAFSADTLYVALDSTFTNYALDEDGYYMYSYPAPLLTSVDLSSAASVGKYAFSYCRSLNAVKLGVSITELPEAVFNSCTALTTINLENVQVIGDYALNETALKTIDLSTVTNIGNYAFYNNAAVVSVTFNPNGASVGEGTFAYCAALKELSNEEFLTVIGDYAFAYTSISEVDLSAAEHIGKHAFMKENASKFKVKLGPTLKELEDNPFAMCELEPFALIELNPFNGIDYQIFQYTYDISETIHVIDGSIYCDTPNGLELITFAGKDHHTTVADNTVRISAMAFAGTDVSQVTLPHTVSAIGHKAFFGCKDLTIVTFSSYNAPVLEEEYDYLYYVSGQNIPATGEYTFSTADGLSEIVYNGLGITPYFMWNAAENPTAVYYGANFIDYIGHMEPSITMVRPINGQNYTSFVYSQYFNAVINGASAADPVAQAAIDAINRLPESVKLSDKDAVTEARRLYGLISTLEQQALVTNYSKLTQAEKRIADLEYLEETQNGTDLPADPNTPDDQNAGSGWIIAMVVILIIFAVAGGSLFLKAKRDQQTIQEAIKDLLDKARKLNKVQKSKRSHVQHDPDEIPVEEIDE